MSGIGIQELLILLLLGGLAAGFFIGIGLAIYFIVTKGRQQ